MLWGGGTRMSNLYPVLVPWLLSTGSCSVFINGCSPFRHHWIFCHPLEQKKNGGNFNKSSSVCVRWENQKVRNRKEGAWAALGHTGAEWVPDPPLAQGHFDGNTWSPPWCGTSRESSRAWTGPVPFLLSAWAVQLLSDSLAAARAEPGIKMLLSVSCK